jgi:hypothetical protein
MGVMGCSRSGCSAIMCDRIILGNTRYICGSCFGELLTCKEAWLEEPLRRSQVEERIIDFMDNTVPGSLTILDRKGIEDEFKRLTREADPPDY